MGKGRGRFHKSPLGKKRGKFFSLDPTVCLMLEYTKYVPVQVVEAALREWFKTHDYEAYMQAMAEEREAEKTTRLPPLKPSQK